MRMNLSCGYLNKLERFLVGLGAMKDIGNLNVNQAEKFSKKKKKRKKKCKKSKCSKWKGGKCVCKIKNIKNKSD